MSKNTKEIFELIDKNIEYYICAKNDEIEKKLKDLKIEISKCDIHVLKLEKIAPNYDFNEKTPSNGLRSLIDIFKISLVKIQKECLRDQEIKINSFIEIFVARNKSISRNLHVWRNILKNLEVILDHLNRIYGDENAKIFELYKEQNDFLNKCAEKIDRELLFGEKSSFYALPFYQNSLYPIMHLMTGVYYQIKDKSLGMKIVKLPYSVIKYLLISNENRGKLLHNCHKNFTAIDWRTCASFSSNEFYVNLTVRWPGVKIGVNKRFFIEPKKLIINQNYEVPIPTCHIGLKSIECRLLSKTLRNGMFGENHNENSSELSSTIIFFVHGGGCIMSNTSSCENFLREIVANTDVPMISVDYSHAPEAPYPRAAEEVFYAYCWMLKNPKYCGSTCERVIIFCDSAGAHLSLYSIFKCIDNNIQLPIHFVSIYGTFCLTNDLFLSSRFLTLMDGMISVEMAETILSAYLQNNKDCDREFISWTAKDEILKKFPKSSLICGTMDPLLDENIVFAKKLNSLGVDVSLITLDKFPHLFACFHNACSESYRGLMVIIDEIKMSIK